jgi:hypothetical protein
MGQRALEGLKPRTFQQRGAASKYFSAIASKLLLIGFQFHRSRDWTPVDGAWVQIADIARGDFARISTQSERFSNCD